MAFEYMNEASPLPLRGAVVGIGRQPQTNAKASAAASSTLIPLVFAACPAVNDTIIINGVTFTFVASGASGAQANIDAGGSLSTTISSMVTVLNASGNGSVSVASYAKGSDNASIVITYKTAGVAGNAFTYKGASSIAHNVTPTVSTHLQGGTAGDVSLEHEVTQFTVGTTALNYHLKDGLEGQYKTLYLAALGSGGSAVIAIDHVAGGTHLTLSTAAGAYAQLRFMAGQWIVWAKSAANAVVA